MKRVACMLLVLWVTSASGAPDAGALKIYIDADFSNHAESSESIERGILTALAPVDSRLGARRIDIVRKDHRGNSTRSRRHIDQYLDDPRALLLVSGIHSPPLLAHRDYINANEVLYLVPWAAAGPITRAVDDADNWIFRLSVDDTKAGDLIVQYAIEELGLRHPYLLLENTGWGKFNHQTMSDALERLEIEAAGIGWFDWNLGAAGARSLIEQAANVDSDSVLLVSNAIEGSVIAREMATRDADALPVVSHWGITGGDFHKRVPHALRQRIGLTFIQTRFSFLQPELSPTQQRVLDDAVARFPEFQGPGDIMAPAGFIHAHDLILLLRAALEDVTLTGHITSIRRRVRAGLEHIRKPVDGLVKTYVRPFSPYAADTPDAHEALGRAELAMARFGAADEIRVLPWRPQTSR